jgi:allophanate hydrolase
MDLARLVIAPTPTVARPGAASLHGWAPGAPWPTRAGLAATPLFVVGAHLREQHLAHQLTDRGARWVGSAVTAPLYRLARLDTAPLKPGLVRVGAQDGVAIQGELWLVSTAMLGDFLSALPAPMTLGSLTLSNGDEVVGFSCALDAWQAGEDISEHGDWTSYLRVLESAAG